MSMKLMHHGGKCCGVKTIFNMGYSPAGIQVAIPACDEKASIGDGTYSCLGEPWYRSARPQEDGLTRLKEYIAYYKGKRAKGILEIVLQTPKKPRPEEDYIGQAAWIPVLLDMGFKEVNSWENSNSSNILHMMHMNIGEKDLPLDTEEEDGDG